MGKVVEVTLENLYCATANDGTDNTLEIFGKIWAKVYFTKPNGEQIEKTTIMLWDVQPYVTVSPNTFLGGSELRTILLDDPLRDFLVIGGYIKEEDDGFWDPNDELKPDRFIRRGYDEINQNPDRQKIIFDETGQRMEANFVIRERVVF
ncbi:hypothetical protein COL01_11430 [Bacillus thuringiensis]|uniref:hypothetical protein n=1 Tax=Bacillus thuringiensis TaxID=1428 RepID=UPI000BF71409|nr:hypothetical protein [Bacillus thuringiensis]PFV34624.1 hypothetical protein COL01_11430 [Bacillus thuringiensis]